MDMRLNIAEVVHNLHILYFAGYMCYSDVPLAYGRSSEPLSTTSREDQVVPHSSTLFHQECVLT